ncbi:MAG: LysR family transcriptional regulator [Pseudomonadales bacterium]|nr:LysR family transcriptional regulator [Pseudomonadales bacterium]
MQDLNEMAIFAKVVEAGSFTKAADRMGLPKSTVSRKISQLEERLDVRLLNRTTRVLKPTETGKLYYQHCSKMLEEAEEADRAITKMQAEPTGTLRISAPLSFGEKFLQQALEIFLCKHPQISVDLVLDNKNLDLVVDEIDVAFRVGPLADSSLVARKLGPAQMVLLASKSYADQHGLPSKPADLENHVLIKHPVGHLELEGPNGIEYIDLPARMVANDMVFIKNMVKRGLGIGGVPLAIAEDELRSGDLVPVLREFPFVTREFYLVYPSRRQLPSKVVAFIDFVMEHCLEELPWNKDFSDLIG